MKVHTLSAALGAAMLGAALFASGAVAAGHDSATDSSGPQPSSTPMVSTGTQKPNYCQYAYAPGASTTRTFYLSNVFMTALYPSSVGGAWQQYIIKTYNTGDAAANGTCRLLSGDSMTQQNTLSKIATDMASAGWKIVHVDWKP